MATNGRIATARSLAMALGFGAAGIGAAGCLALGGCASATNTEGDAMATSGQEHATGALTAVLNERRAEFAANAPETLQVLFDDGVDEVARGGVVGRAVNVGDTAPVFTLPNAVGESVVLSDLLAEGPVVLVWYRGGWCPYCNLTLAAYQDRLGDLDELGATLVAISPELPDNALSTKEKNELEFEVLTDPRNVAARSYGVVFDLPKGVHDSYNELFAFDDWNGQDSGELPLSATYVIRPDGTVAYAFLDADYRVRAEPDEVIAAVRAVAGG